MDETINTHLIQRPYYHITNEEVRAKIQQAIGPHEDLLTIVKRRKLQWFGHVSCSSGLAKTIWQGTVKEGKKTRQTEEEVGRPYQGMDRPGVRQVKDGRREQRKMKETGCEIICGAPTTLAVKGIDDDNENSRTPDLLRSEFRGEYFLRIIPADSR